MDGLSLANFGEHTGEELFDYQRELGVRASSIFGMKKTIYNSIDYGTIVLSTHAAAPTPA